MGKLGPGMVQYPLVFEDELKEKISMLATEHGRSLNQEIVMALKEWIKTASEIEAADYHRAGAGTSADELANILAEKVMQLLEEKEKGASGSSSPRSARDHLVPARSVEHLIVSERDETILKEETSSTADAKKIKKAE